MPYLSERKKVLRKLKVAVIRESLNVAEQSSDSSTEDKTSGSDSSEDDLELLLLAQADILSRRYVMPRGPVPKSCDYVTNILPCLDDRRYRAETRMSREGFDQVLKIVEAHGVFRNNAKYKQKPVALQLTVALYRFGHYGNGASQGNVARKFGVSEGAVELYTDRVITSLNSAAKTYVSWPNSAEKKAIKRSFLDAYGFPDCVGLVDGTLVVLDARPALNGEDYYSRKKLYGLSAAVVCDDTKKILYAYTGFPGSAHDARVYSHCDLSKDPPRFFQGPEYILSDSGYTPSATVVPAYKAPHTGLEENSDFNTYLAEARVANENTIGMLKGRFQSLRGLRIHVRDKRTHKRAVLWFMACCVLHNVLHKTRNCYEEDWTVHELEPLEGRLEEAGRNAFPELMDSGKRKREEVKGFVLTAKRNLKE